MLFRSIGFAVPIDMAASVMNSLLKDGRVVRGWLGAHFQDLNEELAAALSAESSEGALLVEIAARGPAAKGGLQRGDIIRSLNGESIKNAMTLRKGIASLHPGEKITLGILRRGRAVELKITLEDAPLPERRRNHDDDTVE